MDVLDLRKAAADEGIDLDEAALTQTKVFHLYRKVEKQEDGKSRRNWAYVIGTAVAAVISGSGFTAYKATETPAAVQAADEKSDDLRTAEAKVAELESEKAEAKETEVDGRIGGLEKRVDGIDGKMDTLMRLQLAPRDSEVRKAAEAALEH